MAGGTSVTLFTRDLPCRAAVTLVSAYVDGGLTRGQRRRLERHLADCGACSAYLEQIRTTIALTGAVEIESLSDEALNDLVNVYLRYLEDDRD